MSGEDNKGSDLLESVKTLVTQQFAGFKTQLDGVVEKQNALGDKLTELSKPVAQGGKKPSELFGGGAPGIRQGEDTMSSRGYSFGRLLFAVGTRDASQATVEMDVHNRLMQAYGGSVGKGAVLAPLGGMHLQSADPKLASECRQMVRQGVANMDPDEIRWQIRQMIGMGAIKQDLSSFDDTLGGVLYGPTQQGEMIDLLRAREMFANAGAREITLPPNGRIQFPRHAGAGSGYWVGEGQTITESDQLATGMLTMQAKKLAALCDMPNELLRFITMSIEAFIRVEIAKTLALKADSSMLSAVGSALEPKGLTNYSGILTHVATTVGTDGNTFEPQDVAKMVAKVEEQNIDASNFTFVMRPMMWAGASTRRGDAVTAGDAKGPFVFRTQDADMAKGTPNRLAGYPVVKTTQISAAIAKGSATNLTQIIGGVFEEYLIGRAGVMEFATDPYSGSAGTNFKNDVTSIRAITFMDGVPRREEAFVNCTSLVNG